eukprot:TRINITY_DN15867_c0_g2_i1.p1 TRINITY_DN15867_c0_g2~~TRINITY_DN15867_c0_g2_i1.p1  ORF type:complete len:1178 (+),score=273.85 TRINITY_DN15867_c0_g2_i1:254-3787(+)
MAESRRYGVIPKLDIRVILLEAQHRWLRPAEVCEILRNYKKFQLSSEPPHKPTDGSLFLFDRKALRYFRKDGHNWRKKKDGKTVREAHERLKSGSIDVLHCYYAHGEDNENFQRRSYWMLEEQFEHIVLVHYREVKEGNRSSSYHSATSQRPNEMAAPSVQGNSVYAVQSHVNSLPHKSYASSPSVSSWNGTLQSSDFEEVESGEDMGNSISVESESSTAEQGCNQLLNTNTDSAIETALQHLDFARDFTTVSGDNEPSCNDFSLNRVGPGQYPFNTLKPVQQAFADDGTRSQVSSALQDSYRQGYVKREALNLQGLLAGSYSGKMAFSAPISSNLSGCSYSNIASSTTNVGVDSISNANDFNTSSWTDVLELCKSHTPNGTGVKNNPDLAPSLMGDSLKQQTDADIMTAKLRNDETVDGNQERADACLRTPSGNISLSNDQQVYQDKIPQSTLSVSQYQMPGPEFNLLNVLQGRILNSGATENAQGSIYSLPFQEMKTESEKVKLMADDDIYDISSSIQSNKQQVQESTDINDLQDLKKMDSFSRWMSSEIGADSDKALVHTDSGMYWCSLDNQNEIGEVQSLSRQVHLDSDLMAPSVSQDQLFSISDFSPDWAFSHLKTKILITGTFMGDIQDICKQKFSIMFGELEVPAETLGPGILRCYAPPYAPGIVPFYVTRSNRLACSEVREFQYRVTPLQEHTSGKHVDDNAIEETTLKLRFAKLLNCNSEKGFSFCNENDNSNSRDKFSSLINDVDEEWKEMESILNDCQFSFEKIHEKFTQKLLKDKLYLWLLSKVNDGGKGANILDERGQGAIHMAAALGYDWAMSPIVSSGVNVNFRDARGWTALHWAAYYGRERTISALIALKANPGALTDPTHEHPSGQTPADLASNNGHKGIAGYLAESSLTSHLSSLTLNESIMGTVSATLNAEKAVETVAERNAVQIDGGREDQLSMKDSLAAVRNAAQAAARIQAAFRMHSFRRRQTVEYVEDKKEITERQAISLLSKASKSGNHDDPLHAAATRIQRKFRGWKGRKEFLLTRQRIVKIQAHFRGHQVRKKYRIIWSVGIVEKAILRWRRKGTGLRGFRTDDIDESNSTVSETENDDYGFLREARKQTEAGIEKALARVQSMVQYPEARDQYRRLLAIYQESKAETGNGTQTLDENKSELGDVRISMED